MINTVETGNVRALVALARYHAIAQCNDGATMCAADAERCFEKGDYDGAVYFTTRALKYLFGGPLTDQLSGPPTL